MRSLNKIADKLVNRFAPSAKADAASCWWQSCGGPCIKRCCSGTGCSHYCVCPA